jgi:hypothetical protein
MMKLLIALPLLLLCLPLQAQQSSCQNGDFAADGLVTRWDKNATDHKFSDWLPKKYNGLGFIRQQLGKSGLLLVGQVDKHRCVTRLEIKSRRADADGYAALVAWLWLIDATNPTTSKEQRHEVFTVLHLDQPNAGGSFKLGRVTYEFFEDEETNDFSAVPNP